MNNGAMRGFGSPETILITETIMTDIAEKLGWSTKQVKNFTHSLTDAHMHTHSHI